MALLLLVTPVLFPLALLLVALFALALLTLRFSAHLSAQPGLVLVGFRPRFRAAAHLEPAPARFGRWTVPSGRAAHLCLERLVETFPCPDLDRGLVLGQHLPARELRRLHRVMRPDFETVLRPLVD